jgi:hypothetical protein
MSLEDAFRAAKAACDVNGISDMRIVKWFENKDYLDATKRTCLQSGEVGKRNVSVEVRPSFEPDNPWWVRTSVYFDLPTD